MKTVLLHEYNAKKVLADNISILSGSSRYKNISDAEFTRINNAIDTYVQSARAEFDQLHDIGQIESQGGTDANTLSRLEQLETAITNFHSNDIIEVEEDGFYFIDEAGNIGAMITGTGFYAINSNNSGGNSGSSTPSGLVAIDY